MIRSTSFFVWSLEYVFVVNKSDQDSLDLRDSTTFGYPILIYHCFVLRKMEKSPRRMIWMKLELKSRKVEILNMHIGLQITGRCPLL